eukprot:6179185-Pleurochrysis_carterae.AAC.1
MVDKEDKADERASHCCKLRPHALIPSSAAGKHGCPSMHHLDTPCPKRFEPPSPCYSNGCPSPPALAASTVSACAALLRRARRRRRASRRAARVLLDGARGKASGPDRRNLV